MPGVTASTVRNALWDWSIFSHLLDNAPFLLMRRMCTNGEYSLYATVYVGFASILPSYTTSHRVDGGACFRARNCNQNPALRELGGHCSPSGRGATIFGKCWIRYLLIFRCFPIFAFIAQDNPHVPVRYNPKSYIWHRRHYLSKAACSFSSLFSVL